MAGAGRQGAACSLLAVAALFSIPSLATPSVTCFHSGAPSLPLTSLRTARLTPSVRRSLRPESRTSTLLDPSDGRRQRLLVTAMTKQGGADSENRGKRRFFGLGGGNDDSSSSDKNDEPKKQRRLDFFRRKDKDKDKKKDKNKKGKEKNNGKRGISVDINAFVGPRMPIDSEVSLKAMLDLTPEEKDRRAKAKKVLEDAERKRRETKERMEAKVKKANEKAKKEAEARMKEEQRQKEIRERNKAVLQAASSSSGTKDVKSKAVKEDQRQKEVRERNKEARMKEEQRQKEIRERNKAVLQAATSSSGESEGTKDVKSKAGKRQGGGVLSGAQSFVSSVFGGDKQREEWVVLCPKTRIQPGEVVPIVSGGLDLLLVASRDGKRLACIANSCPHLGTPLETGIVERRPVEGPASRKPDVAEDGCEDCIVCPTHQTAFALASGEVRGEWCPYPPVLGKMMGTVKTETNLPTFSVRARGKNIEVRLNSSLDDINKQ